ncbi:choice-of-anchor E domain-containing protein [Duganella vulcania]|uniref:Choice-of-anchor E domain-containing protein n=1 Tax=Duganella vulcania TaxID=2692166 RepID=A0A845GNI0_9BURK|nr:choice-of-anchor E domain-containing protein [Duganella vulcania]MYM94287.1 choice-of-anchor E domain-containing protein [Duganella vulcania]
MNLNKIAQALFVAGCLVCATASAATQTFTSNVVASTQTDLAAVLNFAQFDASLGTLTSVKFDLFADVSGKVDLSNYNNDAITVPVSLSVDVWLNRPDHSALVLFSAPLLNQDATIDGNGTLSLNNAFSMSNSASYNGAGDLSLFTGNGNVATLFAAKAYTQANGDGVESDFLTKVGGYGKVTYTYTAAPVPEPETYGMLLAGLALVGVAAKRKSRKA